MKFTLISATSFQFIEVWKRKKFKEILEIDFRLIKAYPLKYF